MTTHVSQAYDFAHPEAAYAELVFTRTMWPDFGPEELTLAVREFQNRERRFGGIPYQTVRQHEAWLD